MCTSLMTSFLSIGHKSVVRMLTDAGANLDHRTHGNGKCALLKASVRGHTEIVKMLLLAGANANILKTYDEASSLYAAAYAGKVEVMELLIAHNARLENRMIENSLVTLERNPKYYGSTPLIVASFFSQAEAVQVLSREPLCAQVACFPSPACSIGAPTG